MEKTYRGVLRNSSGGSKKVVYFQNKRFIFEQGVCDALPESVARFLLSRKILKEIKEVSSGIVTTDEVTEEATDVLEAVEEVNDTVVEPVATVVTDQITDAVTGTNTNHDEIITKDFLEDLYSNLGTWTAVAEYMNVSIATLKKYRTELGL